MKDGKVDGPRPGGSTGALAPGPPLSPDLDPWDRIRFLSNLGTELGEPLAAIARLAEALETEAADALNPRRMRLVRQIRFGCEQVRELMGDLLDSTRLDAGTLDLEIEQAEIAPLLRQALGRVAPEVAIRRMESVIEAEPGLRVPVDRRRFVQALTILLRWAVRTSPEGGWITLGSWGDGKTVHVSVSDTSDPSAGGPEGDERTPQSIDFCRRLLRAQGGEIELRELGRRGRTAIISLRRERPALVAPPIVAG